MVQFACFLIRKISVKLMWRSYIHLCLLQNFLRDRSMFWNYIGDGEIRVPHHFLKMSPYIQFVVGESLGSLWVLWILFLSSTNLFIESFLKILYELSICFDTIPSNYRPKKRHAYFTHSRSDKIDHLRLRGPISYCKTKNRAHVFVFVKGIHFQCLLEIKLTTGCDKNVIV